VDRTTDDYGLVIADRRIFFDRAYIDGIAAARRYVTYFSRHLSGRPRSGSIRHTLRMNPLSEPGCELGWLSSVV
jgi:hypothetical protein